MGLAVNRARGSAVVAGWAAFAKAFVTAGYVCGSGGVVGAKEKPASCSIPA